MIPKKVSPQNYILSSTTIHCRSLPFKKDLKVFKHKFKTMVDFNFKKKFISEKITKNINFFC